MRLLGTKPLRDGNGAGRWGGSGVTQRVPQDPCLLLRDARQAVIPHPHRKAAGAARVLSPGAALSRCW